VTVYATQRAAYGWDNQGRMTSMTTPSGSTYQYQYDAMSNLTQMTGPNSFSENATYNWAGQRSR